MKGGVGLAVLFLVVTLATADDRPKPNPVALAADIDRLVLEKLAAHHVAPAPPADDAAFFRRVNLALAGRIPVPSDVRAFLAATSPDKRARAVDRVLASTAYANHLTTSWRGWLLPEAVTSPDVANAAPGLEAWLHARMRTNLPLDRLVTELLTYPLDGRAPAGRVRGDVDADDGTGPLAFFTAKEGKPENLAAATARVFLGVHLECAQCHDHPYARWSRDQFWGLAAFYGGVERPNGGGLREVPGRRELLIPNSTRAVPATFLDDREPEWEYKKSARATLAAWVTAADNPFFARAMANRLWWLVFGVGLVDPVDDFHDRNPPSHPELLDRLARALVESGFDAKFLLRAVCLSETFGRASIVADRERHDVRLFAHFPIQALSPEQLIDSLAVALGQPLDEPANAGIVRAVGTPRRQLLETFAATGRQTDAPTTILQALTLMNGNLVGTATGPAAGRTLGAVATLPGLTPTERIESLYLAALGRPPQPRELERALQHVGAGDAARDRYGDIFWALLNGVEFRTNH
jgi:hypothetical protein